MYKLDTSKLKGLSAEERKVEVKRQVDAMRNPSSKHHGTRVFGAAKAMVNAGASTRHYHNVMRAMQAPHRTRRPVGRGFSATQVTARDKSHVHNRALRDSGKLF